MAKENPVYAALAPLGFETAGQVCFGRGKGYAVSLRPNGGYYYLEFAVRCDKKDAQLRKAVQKALKARCPKNTYACVNNGSFFSFPVRFTGKGSYGEQFSAFADAIAEVLRENGLAPAHSCAICGSGAAESLCMVTSFQPVHAACMRGQVEQIREEAEQNRENGSYLGGVIGALLGTLVGLIPSVLTVLLIEGVSAWLFALVPLCAMWGYRKLGGKRNNAAIVIVILLSLLGVFLLEYIQLVAYLIGQYHAPLGLTLNVALQNFMDPEMFPLVLKDCAIPLLFMVLGIALGWRYLRQTNSETVKAMGVQLDTLRPNPDYTDLNL